MQRFFILSFFLLFPLQLFASVGQTTMQYLTQAGNDPWVVMARAAVGEDAGNPAIARENVFALAKTILAFVASGKDVRVAGGSDFVVEFLQQHVRDGQIGNPAFLNDDFWGILALRAAGVPADHPALVNAKAMIIRTQDSRGGWSWSAAPDTPDTDDTAAAVMALLELGISSTDPVLSRSFLYLNGAQNSDGGFPNVPPGVSSVDSTAWVAMALQKAGLDASRALSFLQSRMRPDGSWGSPATTAFATIALAGKWFPVRQFDAAVSPSDDTLRFRESQSVSLPAGRQGRRDPSVSAPLSPYGGWSVGPLGLERGPHSASPLRDALTTNESALFPLAPPVAITPLPPSLSTPPLLSVDERVADSVPRVLFPPAFFPALSAQSVFSRKEMVTVVHAAIDSDGDGYSDDVEIAKGYDPYDARPVKITKSKKQKIKKAPRTILRQAQEVRGKQKKK